MQKRARQSQTSARQRRPQPRPRRRATTRRPAPWRAGGRPQRGQRGERRGAVAAARRPWPPLRLGAAPPDLASAAADRREAQRRAARRARRRSLQPSSSRAWSENSTPSPCLAARAQQLVQPLQLLDRHGEAAPTATRPRSASARGRRRRRGQARHGRPRPASNPARRPARRPGEGARRAGAAPAGTGEGADAHAEARSARRSAWLRLFSSASRPVARPARRRPRSAGRRGPRGRPFSAPDATAASSRRSDGSRRPASAARNASSRRAARSRAGAAPSSPNRRTRGANGRSPASAPAASPRHSTRPSGASANASSGSAAMRPEPPRDLRGRPRAGRRRAAPCPPARWRPARRLEREPVQAADEVALHRHRAVGGDAGQQFLGLAEPAHQRAGAPVDEPRHQLLVQRVGEPVLERAGDALPVRPGRPASRAGWRRRPGCARWPAASRARRSRRRCGRACLNWPAIQSSGTRSSPSVRCSNSVAASRTWSSSVVLRKSGVWQASQSRNSAERSRQRAGDALVGGQLAQGGLVQRLLGRPSAPRAAAGAASERSRSASESKSSRALRHSAGGHRLERGAPPPAATRSSSIASQAPVTPNVPSRRKRPARPAIWPTSCGVEPAGAPAVELGQAREGDVAQVHVEAHADGVGGHQEVHLAGLVERHLGVAGARAERSPSPPPRRRAGGGSARRWRRPRRRRRRRRRCGAAGG